METANNTEDIFKPISFLPMFLSFHRHSVSNEIEIFKNYIVDNRTSINNAKEELVKKINEEIEKYQGQEHDIHEYYQDQYYQYKEFYPSIFNNSTLLSLYSFFELNLKELCNTIGTHSDLKRKPKHLNGQNYVEKSRHYLELVIGINLSDLQATWEKITFYRRIRNKIAHNNSSIVEKSGPITSQPLYDLIVSNPNLKLKDTNGTFFISNDQFLLDFCDLIEHYIVPIIQKVEANVSTPKKRTV